MKHTIFFYLVATAFVLVGATACSSGDDGDEPANPTPTQPEEYTRIPLTVEVEEQPVRDAATAREGMTRTDITYLQNLTQFSMDFYKDKDRSGHYDFSKNNNQWTTKVNDQTWPGSETGVYPFCFYAYTSTGSANPFQGGSDPYISVSVDENAFEQKDVLVAKSEDFSGPQNRPVRLTFDHICAAVGFTIKMTDKLANKLNGTALYVKDIQLQAIAKSGDYHFDGRWTGVSNESTYYTLTYSNAMQVTVGQQAMKDTQGNDFYLFMIPQQTTAVLKVSYKIGELSGNDTYTDTYINGINIDWKQGYRYFIDINLGTANISVP